MQSYDIMHFTDPEMLTTWINENGTTNTIFLCDYEFIGHQMNGIDIIQKFNITSQSILITSRYEDANIKNRCESINLGLIPKPMTELVPLSTDIII